MAARLITDADVREGRAGDPIVVDADTNITPAALDRAAALGLRVVFARGGGAPGAARPDGGALARAALPVLQLPDGQYLVSVDHGQARVFRLTAQGPVPLEA
ncbi:MAG: hypothetical protein HY812_04505 [Planctomycetes bacterium]|nr:hypothetical protein [Planctomycetota bacterium]